MAFFRWSSRTNETVNAWAAKVDGPTGLAARDAAGVLVFSMKILRWPTWFLLAFSAPLLAGTALMALLNEGAIAAVAGVVFGLELFVWVAFAWRRQRILQAIDDPEALATQIGVAAEMSGRPEEITGVLTTLSKQGGSRIMTRLRSLWSKTPADATWIRRVSDLDRARYFFPPSIGRTTLLTLAMLWLVPLSVLATFLLFVASIAN